MLRTLLIVTTILATTLGSLGLPIYLHTCRMMAMEMSEPAGCPMCGAEEDGRPVVPATGHSEDGSCCDDAVAHQRTDTGTLVRAEMPMPLFVGLVAFVAVELGLLPTPSLPAGEYGHSPPGLAARAQHTYLLNSSFLI